MENYNLHRRAQSGWHPTTYSRPVDKKPERNWAALMEAAKRPPVGYYEDAPRGIQFGGGGKPNPQGADTRVPTAAPSSPIPDGARGDVWPKWVSCGSMWLARYDDEYTSECYNRFGAKDLKGRYASIHGYQTIPQSEALAWLDANGHKAYADSLRQPRKQVEGRVWRWKNVTSCPNGHYADIGGVMYFKDKETFWRKSLVQDADRADTSRHTELFGPEADAIIRECAKAMGLDHGTR